MAESGVRLAAAVRDALRDGYGIKDLRQDIVAGLVVALVAIPLGMALAIAIGAPPQNGLYTVIVAGIVVALLGGSRYQITGPTAAFVVILIPVVKNFGLSGLMLAGLLSGVIVLVFGLLRAGRVIEFLPHPVTTGFTSGIALVIFTLQIKDLLGLTVTGPVDHYWERVAALAKGLPTIAPAEAVIGLSSLVVMVVVSRYVKKTAGPITGLTFAVLLAIGLEHMYPDLNIRTIANQFFYEANGQKVGGIPPWPPTFMLPEGLLEIDYEMVKTIFPMSLAIAFLAAIESLMSAVVADAMTGRRHDPNAELVALGVGNIVCPFFGGIPATGAIARTATNIRYGARSPFASVVHAIAVLFCMMVVAPYVSMIPMAALAALLVIVAYNMSEIHHFKNILRVGTREDRIVLLSCFGLTVFIDMVAGVLGGVVMASILFMHRMARLTEGRTTEERAPAERPHLPRELEIYEIEGPMFFGAAQRALTSLTHISGKVRHVIIDMRHVPIMDATGLTALESALKRLRMSGITCSLAGVQPAVRKILRKSGDLGIPAEDFFPSVEMAVSAILDRLGTVGRPTSQAPVPVELSTTNNGGSPNP